MRAFFGRKTLLPVIHVRDSEQTLRNVAIAQTAGADGVFLINHSDEQGNRPLSFRDLVAIHAQAVAAFPAWWIGVNCLDLAAAAVFQHVDETVSAVWVDNGEIDEDAELQTAAATILRARQQAGWQGTYFAGVAFKYQRPVKALARAARIGSDYIDVVTTSGPGTGQSASAEKIATMKGAIGDKPLAIASGITPENVATYLPFVDVFLVATGISHSFFELDAAKVAHLATSIHQADQKVE